MPGCAFLEIKGKFLLYTSRFPSTPDPKDIKMLSVLNKRFLFVAVSVIARLLWFSVVTIVNSGLHLGCLIKQKKPVAVNNHTAQPSRIPPLYLEGMVQTRNKPATIHWSRNSSGSLFSVVWWLENSTCVTHPSLPACPPNT